jgi:hypothetical protein
VEARGFHRLLIPCCETDQVRLRHSAGFSQRTRKSQVPYKPVVQHRTEHTPVETSTSHGDI